MEGSTISRVHGKTQDVSVIIPTLNEASRIRPTLDTCQDHRVLEQIVVDGGSQDGTAEVACQYGARVLITQSGRALQMNRGAAEAKGKILLFLHADTSLPEGFSDHIHPLLRQSGVVAGAFLLRIDGESLSFRLIETVANWRSRFGQMPYGDQAIFLTLKTFRENGGYRELPVMEDFDLIWRLRKQGRIKVAPIAAKTSSRRWHRQGIWRTTLVNQLMILGYAAGVSPERMARLYHSDKDS